MISVTTFWSRRITAEELSKYTMQHYYSMTSYCTSRYALHVKSSTYILPFTYCTTYLEDFICCNNNCRGKREEEKGLQMFLYFLNLNVQTNSLRKRNCADKCDQLPFLDFKSRWITFMGASACKQCIPNGEITTNKITMLKPLI